MKRFSVSSAMMEMCMCCMRTVSCATVADMFSVYDAVNCAAEGDAQ